MKTALNVILIALVILIACGDNKQTGSGKIKIVATTGMIADLAANIGGDRVEVEGLMGPGVDPHLYKASAGDVTKMQSADIIFYNGLHLEGAMSELFDKMKSSVRTSAVSDGIDPAMLTSPPEFEGAHDPHVWFDVSLWISCAEQVKKSLMEFDTAGASVYAGNAEEYTTKLHDLDNFVKSEIGKIPDSLKVLITAHDAFNYFGRAYDIEVRGLQGISTVTEAGTADVRDLAEFISARKIPAIFVESSVPPRTIKAVQAAVRDRGHDVAIGGELFSDALGNPGTPEGTYIGMVRHNVNTIVSALAGETSAYVK